MMPAASVSRHSFAHRALQEAERLCVRRALRFTALRRRVLQIVCQSRRPPKAYEILKKLGGQAQPPTVYRTLYFLEEQGFLHKIKSRSAYTACAHPRTGHACYFLLCVKCGRCDECCNGRLAGVIDKTAHEHDFSLRSAMVEIEGVCVACRDRI